MIKYTEDIINKIHSTVRDKGFSVCALLSNKGYGKLTLAKQFVLNYGYDFITINTPPEHYNHLYPLSNAFKENTTDYQHLYLRIIEFLNSGRSSAFIFNGSECYQEELIRIITEVTSFCANNVTADNSVVFLFLVNGMQPSDLLDKYFAEFSRYVNYIFLEKWKEDDLLELFKAQYPVCDYQKGDLNKIINLSFSNPGDFISNLEELKRRQVFVRSKDNSWKLFEFNTEILSRRMVRVVQERYEKLDDNLKEAIKKASIIGKEFDSKTLENPLKVVRAQQLLIQIEDVSQLIYKTLPDYSLYCFENDEAYLSIDSYIKEEDRKIWNRAIAGYFANEIQNEYAKSDEQKIDELLRKTGYYFKKAEDYKDSLSYQMKLISRCFANANYSQVVRLVKEIKSYPKDYLTNEIRKIILIYSIESYEVLCKFENAFNEYHEFEKCCQVRSDVLSWGIIKKAFYYYYNNDTPKAYHTLLFIKDMKDPCTEKNAKLYIEAYSMLSAFGETLGHEEYVQHYNYALSLAKKFRLADSYYRLLRKANAVHVEEAGIHMMLKAYEYFRDKNKHMYAMTAHNIGTQYALILNGSESLKYLREAEQLFKESGSAGLLPTLNSIAVYYLLIEHHFEKALTILKELNTSDDFQQLALLNNIATCKRKLGYLDETGKLIAEITNINHKSANQFRWYEECLILQNAYLCKAQNKYEEALGHFSYYMEQGFGILKANKVSVIKNIVYLSGLLAKPLSHEVETVKNAYDRCGQAFYEHDLMVSDLMFWE